MSEMVERVAAAIYEAENRYIKGEWKLVRGEEWIRVLYHTLAREAFEAMREPTEEMTKQAFYHDHYLSVGQAERCWKSMIEAALK